MKELKDMTLEELWQLFPIVLTPHRPEWSTYAQEEMTRLADILADFTPTIHHIGSTAIPVIQAKPIIDILVEVDAASCFAAITELLEASGYICMASSPNRLSFNKGYTSEGYARRVFHIHIHLKGDNDEIYFRNYLRNHPSVAKEYEALKLSLLPRYCHDRDGYTAAKTRFIRHITAIAKSATRH